MSDQANLLRMLEPSVRPGGVPGPRVEPRKPVEASDFGELLERMRERNPLASIDRPLKLSAHAQQRLEERGLTLNDGQLAALSRAAEQAEGKGARDALMLMDDLGMIVNVPNRTVLTVLDEARMTDGVVTQIDSAVIVKGHQPTLTEQDAEHRLRL